MERKKNELFRVPYCPFPTIRGFSIYTDARGNICLLDFEDDLDNKFYCLEIDERSMVPRDALLMTDFIKKFVSGKDVLDIGTGGGILAIQSAVYGARSVVGIDIDDLVLECASNNGELNNLDITWKLSNLFSNLGSERFDLVLSNPPQLPMRSGQVRDTGGPDGRQIVERIIMECPNYLNNKGVLLMVLFDFLGVDTSYGPHPPLLHLFESNGFQVEIVRREKTFVRKGGHTERSSSYILEQYPRYKFETRDGEIIHEKLVVKAQLKNNIQYGTKIT